MKPSLHNLIVLLLGTFLATWVLLANLSTLEPLSGGFVVFGLLGVGLLMTLGFDKDDSDLGGPPGVKSGTICNARLVQRMRTVSA